MKTLEILGYDSSSKFVRSTNLDVLPPDELSFALRKWSQIDLRLSPKHEARFEGAYVLQESRNHQAVPVVYVFEADSESTAMQIHRLVWNQNVVPYLIVESKEMVRVYPAFSRPNAKALIVTNVAEALTQLHEFKAEAIDNGNLWSKRSQNTYPLKRVDETLLDDLRNLDRILQEQRMPRSASHGLIGKFVYFYYLLHRGILSDRKLEKWGIDKNSVFGSSADIGAFNKLNTELQRWLNGSVFTFGEETIGEVSQRQLQSVADVFKGGKAFGQSPLGFDVYDFSFIPIETLSCVYEQFLHDSAIVEGSRSRAQKLGAYYTPIPLTDFMIAELERHHPLETGMRVLDPSCGSGAFLVQCYRRLIEKRLRVEEKLRPVALRDILVDQIFGVDRDEDACRVAELSLILTLLDYVQPPDLESTSFQLPTLRDRNIFRADFFDDEAGLFGQGALGILQAKRFDWIIGNPPWSEAERSSDRDHEHYHVWQWLQKNRSTYPVGRNQIAEAFLWKVGEYASNTGVVGLLVPAMTWFKEKSTTFRQQFFSRRGVWCVANFANMAYVLFAGRTQVPASAVFFDCKVPDSDDVITTFAPFIVGQLANRPSATKRTPIWNIIVNRSDLKCVPNKLASNGEAFPWKVAMWASPKDAKIIHKLAERFPKFSEFAKQEGFLASEGLQLRHRSSRREEPIERLSELIGKDTVDFSKLREQGIFFAFPPKSMETIQREGSYVRKGRAQLPFSVSRPPHIILDKARRFSVFLDRFVAVPPAQIGIAGPQEKENMLRALSLFLSSDFCKYHQFLISAESGIQMDRAELYALRILPIPIGNLNSKDLREWVKIQKRLAKLSLLRFNVIGPENYEEEFVALINELNLRAFESLGLNKTEMILIEDFVKMCHELKHGKITSMIVSKPRQSDMMAYLKTLRDTLDEFVSSDNLTHKIEVMCEQDSALISISVLKSDQSYLPKILSAGSQETQALRAIRENLFEKHSQWVYFNRGLKIYADGTLYQFKPMETLYWSRRQAILDADEIIAETLEQGIHS